MEMYRPVFTIATVKFYSNTVLFATVTLMQKVDSTISNHTKAAEGGVSHFLGPLFFSRSEPLNRVTTYRICSQL